MQSDRSNPRPSLDDLLAFAAVARTRSFTKAAADLGISNSMLSYTIRRLEERLGQALLRRTSRSVAPTEAGETLLRTLEPALDAIHGTLAALDRERDRVAGTLRITATRQAYEIVLRPVLAEFSARHPQAAVEVIIDYGLRDLVADRFDAGIRLHEKLEQDMVAFRVGPETLRMAVVASPAYLASHPAPRTPEALREHRGINYRMVTSNTLYAWEFEQGGRELKVALEGPLTTNEPDLMLQAAVDGLGVAYVLENEAAPQLAAGRLVRLLEDWTPPFPGYCLYYPSRKQASPVLAALLALLRARREQAAPEAAARPAVEAAAS